MSTVVVVSIENVLTAKQDRGTAIPIASPNMTMVRFLSAVSTQFSIGYITRADKDQALAWLNEVGAPLGAWILPNVPAHLRALTAMSHIGRNRDRCVLFIADTAEGFDRLAAAEIPTMLFHSGTYVIGDWKQQSSWVNPEPEEDDDDDDLVGRH